MSFLDNARRAFGVNPDEDYENERDYDYEDEEDEKPRKSFFSFLTGKSEDDYENEYEEEIEEPVTDRTRHSSYYGSSSRDRYTSSSRNSSPTDRSQIKYNPASANTEVILVPLVNFDDSEKIVREVKNGKITLFDVSEIESTEDARRIVDYISGVAAGMECPFSRLCNGIFCIAPKGVKITAKKSRYM